MQLAGHARDHEVVSVLLRHIEGAEEPVADRDQVGPASILLRKQGVFTGFVTQNRYPTWRMAETPTISTSCLCRGC
jgi:hypothetical protein